MPPLEDSFMNDTAVLWPFKGFDRHGEPVVDSPVEINCRWSESDHQAGGVGGGTDPAEAQVEVDQYIPIGSLMWKGLLEEWDATQPHTLFQVVERTSSRDVKGRWRSRRVVLRKFSSKLPAQATIPTTVPVVVDSGGDKNYVYSQLSPASVWTIVHNLGKHPSVTVVDSGGSWVIGDVSYPALEMVVVSFGYGFSGTAYLN
jgi:hypothetical protein